MNKVKLRQIHRKLAPILFLPLAITAITGVTYQIATSWFDLDLKQTQFLLDIHRGNLPGLEKVYPVLNGLGLIAMIITGLSMTGLFGRRKPNRDPQADRS